MGKVVTIVSGSGGNGITFITSNLGYALSAIGKKVCVVDANLCNRNLDLFLALENRIVYDLGDLINGECEIEKTLLRFNENMSLIPSSAIYKKPMNFCKAENAIEIIDNLKEMFDFVLIDCPSGLKNGYDFSRKFADIPIVITESSVFSVRSADRLINLLWRVDNLKPSLIVNKHIDISVPLNQISSILGVEEFLGVIDFSEEIIVSNQKGIPIASLPETEFYHIFKKIAKKISNI